MKRFLAGDVGGTKTLLALFAVGPGGEEKLCREETLPSPAFPDLFALVRTFLKGEAVDAACLGVPGPLVEGRAAPVNLPWPPIEAAALRSLLGTERVALLNDVQAIAYGTLFLAPDRFLVLQPGRERRATRAVIAAGTGLGQAYLHWDGARYLPGATEGGHASFAATGEREWQLKRYLAARYGHVSWERVVSGPGLADLVRYLRAEEGRRPAPAVVEALATAEAPARIGEAAVAGVCPVCREAAEWFLRLYGEQAGNLALTVLALGGVEVGGGIALRLLPLLREGAFLEGFLSKGRYRSLLAEIPVRVILEPRVGLIGAAAWARRLLEEGTWTGPS